LIFLVKYCISGRGSNARSGTRRESETGVCVSGQAGALSNSDDLLGYSAECHRAGSADR
jgi:hypothetical protein